MWGLIYVAQAVTALIIESYLYQIDRHINTEIKIHIFTFHKMNIFACIINI